MKKGIIVLIIGTLFVSLITGCITGGEDTNEDGLYGTLSLAGSTTVQPIASAASEEFMALHPNVIITIQGGGSGTGITQVAQGTVDIGNASRDLKDVEREQYEDLVANAIAADGIAVIVNPSNPVSELSMEQIKKIFTGEITNWSQLGWVDKSIVVVIREDGSGTRSSFEEIVHKKVEPTSSALQKSSNGSIKMTVAQGPYAIGYVGLGFIDDTISDVLVDGVVASEETIVDGSYPISRLLYMFTKGQPIGLEKEFIEFILSPRGQELVVEEGFVRIA
ncbi:MAG: phosphate ABC transporter substrate-binding protein [Candidatus Methanofastidiosia archaeon]